MTAGTPRSNYSGSEVATSGELVDVEYEDGPILWDDNSAILYDDNSPILWSHMTPTNTDMQYAFSVPRTSYPGEA